MGKVAASPDGPLRVLHVVGGPLGGGAARGAHILSRALSKLGLSSHILCADPHLDPNQEGVSSVASGFMGRTSTVFRSKLERLPVRALQSGTGSLFSMGMSGINLTDHPAYAAADIVHLHWINGGMLAIKEIGRIDKPCVWTMRDMWPFTGGCHYALDCNRYTEGCGNCPQLKSRHSSDLSDRIFRRKQAAFCDDVTYVGISEWVTDCAKASQLLTGQDIRKVINCIDTSAFRPMEKTDARKRLGLSNSKPIVLHGALSRDDTYKGYPLFQEAQKILDRQDIYFCAFGSSKDNSGADRDFGVISDDEKMREIYAAADLLVFPSIQEAFGKVPAEAMACGTPAVVFDATGPGEIVDHKVTGFAAKPFQPEDLAAGISWMLEDPERLKSIGKAASLDAARRFDPLTSAKRYSEIYREMVAQR